MAATDAMVALYSTTLAAATSSVTIAGIPANGYRDLRLVINCTTSGVGTVRISLNGDTTANYASLHVRGNRSGGTDAARSGYETSVGYFSMAWSNFNTGSPAIITHDIIDSFSTNKQKTTLTRSGYTDDAANTVVEFLAGRWNSLAAVSSLNVFMSASTFAAGSTFELFGIKA